MLVQVGSGTAGVLFVTAWAVKVATSFPDVSWSLPLEGWV